MRLLPVLCWALSRLGWDSEMVEMESYAGTLHFTVCTRCNSYLMESHGLTFSGRISRIPEELPNIGNLLNGIGYTVAAREVTTLVGILQKGGVG